MPMKTAATNYAPASATPSVAGLLLRVDDGDPAAWAEIMHRYGALVSATVRSFRLQDADALDAVRTTWLRLAKNATSAAQAASTLNLLTNPSLKQVGQDGPYWVRNQNGLTNGLAPSNGVSQRAVIEKALGRSHIVPLKMIPSDTYDVRVVDRGLRGHLGSRRMAVRRQLLEVANSLIRVGMLRAGVTVGSFALAGCPR